MSQSKGPEDYTARLTDCTTLSELQKLLVAYGDLAIDGGRVVARMTDDDFREFRRGLKSERKGRFAGEAWMERFGAVLLPLPMLRISALANEFHAPFDVAWRRIKELRPDMLSVPDGETGERGDDRGHPRRSGTVAGGD